MKTTEKLSALALTVICATALAACSGNDDPQPALAPGEIPMVDTVTQESRDYRGYEYMITDTVSYEGVGNIFTYEPCISIYDSPEAKTESTADYDDEIHFVLASDGKEYRVGSLLPKSDKKDPIGHHIFKYPGVDDDVKPLVLGSFVGDVNHYLTMYWPKKNLRVYLRIYSYDEQITLPEVWRGHELTNRQAKVHHFGLFVNGICLKNLRLNIVLQPDGTVRLFGRPDGLKL